MMRPPRAGATLAVLCLLAMAGCEQPGGTSSRPQPPAVPAEKESGLAAGMLVITLKSAIDGIEIQRPATVKTGAQQAQWTPAESAKLTQLDSRAAHTISVEGPYLADRVDVKFDDSASGKRVEILVLPRFVDGSEPSESERPIAKYLEILLSQDGSAKASWMQRGTAVSTFDLPAAGPVGPTLQEQ